MLLVIWTVLSKLKDFSRSQVVTYAVKVVIYQNGAMYRVFGRPLQWRLLQVTVRPMQRDRCPVLPFCNVGVLWPNDWMDQDATWYGGRPQPRRHFIRWDLAPPRKGAQQVATSTFRPTVWLRPNDRPSQQLLSSCHYRPLIRSDI